MSSPSGYRPCSISCEPEVVLAVEVVFGVVAEQFLDRFRPRSLCAFYEFIKASIALKQSALFDVCSWLFYVRCDRYAGSKEFSRQIPTVERSKPPVFQVMPKQVGLPLRGEMSARVSRFGALPVKLPHAEASARFVGNQQEMSKR